MSRWERLAGDPVTSPTLCANRSHLAVIIVGGFKVVDEKNEVNAAVSDSQRLSREQE